MAPIITTNRNMRVFSLNSSQGSITTTPPTTTSFTLPPYTSSLSKVTGARVALKRTPSNIKLPTTTSPDRTIKCATVTMMLAERIIRNGWSVEDEHFFESNNMNVWQTLEYLSSLNARKRYNYEGYNDANNALRTLTPSWRRDSFVEKSGNPNADESSKTTNRKYTTVANSTTAPNETRDSASAGQRITSGCIQSSNNTRHQTKSSKSASVSVSGERMRRGKHKVVVKELDPEYALSPSDYADLIKCTFNLPRISAALERLMGTNVVRLTDRNYMKELRERIEDDYRANLQKRIKARELKEVERERILIIEGKTNVIPAELADDPIFVVDKKADGEILKSRAKLKTNREKNSERLKLLGVKWERERVQHEEEEIQRNNALQQRYREQAALEDQYRSENADRSMDLLRIDNEDWRPCEQTLREFLEQERAKMKERSLRIPTPFTTDPKDINKIIKARKAFRDVERRIRKAIADNHSEQQQQVPSNYPNLIQSQEQANSKAIEESIKIATEEAKNLSETEDVDTLAEHKNLASDNASDISSAESFNGGSSISMARDSIIMAKGLSISEDQYDHLRYKDPKIMQLKNAKDIRELYQLAEEIIIGERIESYADEDAEVESDEGEGHEPELKPQQDQEY